MKIVQVTLFLFYLINFVSLQGQTCCSAGAPITSSFDIGASEDGVINLQLNYECNSVNRLIDQNEILKNDPRNRSGQNLLLKADFVLNKKWAFSAFLPYVKQKRTTISDTEQASGLGDLSLLFPFHYRNGMRIKKVLP